MYRKTVRTNQQSLFFTLEDQLNQKHPLYILTNKIDWELFEEKFKGLYSQDSGSPCVPIRRMVGLMILKHLRNISDESVVEQWQENVYYQYFCGEQELQVGAPCSATELVEFRKRIGTEGAELILRESIRTNDDHDKDDTGFIDSTVQEKNVTFPTDAKLTRKVIRQCQKLSKELELPVRQSYRRVLKSLYREQRFRNHPKNNKRALRADKKVKTIAGRLLRELERNLRVRGAYDDYAQRMGLWHRVLNQKKDDKHDLFCKRAGIEPVIGHLKSDHRLGRNFYKGTFGDDINIMYAAAAYNFKRAMRLFLCLISGWIARTQDGIDALYGNKSPRIGFSTLPIIRSAHTSLPAGWTF